MIYFDRVSKQYTDGSSALEDISLEIQPGEFVSVVGHSGAGKTTLLKMIWAEEKPTHGAVYFQQQNIHRLNSGELSRHRRRIGVVFQDYRLLAHKTVAENVAFLMEAAGRPDHEIASDVPYALDLVDLADKMHRFPHQLSEGEQQRLAIARAIVNQPDMVIADEPTGNLDPAATYEVVQILKKINELGTTVVLTTHSKGVVDSLKKRVVTLEDGKIIGDEQHGSYKTADGKKVIE